MFAHIFYVGPMTSINPLPEVCQASLAQHLRPDLFKALCDPVRLSIVATLAAQSGPVTVSALAECCGIDFSGVSRHLKLLRDAGVVVANKNGREMLYTLETVELAQTLRGFADALIGCKQAAEK